MINIYNEEYGISDETIKLVDEIEEKLADKFREIDKIREYNEIKVIKAMQSERLSQAHFSDSSGYGYGDMGRDKVESIFSKVFKGEDSLVRSAISSGTHALSLTLFGLLNYGDKMLAITGHPYDTLQEVIGIKGKEKGTLIERGVTYDMVDLINQEINYEEVKNKLRKDSYKLVLIQRSTGYTERKALSIDEIQKAIKVIREVDKDVIIMVDNCYGEFTETREPLEVGADVMVGSLIKNPGGGIALSGGYITGKKEIIERVSNYLYAPGLGKETGLSFGQTRPMLQGLYFAPYVTMEAVKTAILFQYTYNSLGYKVIPSINSERSDIICAIQLGRPELVIDFCKAIQKASTVDSYVDPTPWEMPGYQDKIIMATGGFVDGSSIEISADGPLREPYIVYYQGGLTLAQGRLALYMTLEALKKHK